MAPMFDHFASGAGCAACASRLPERRREAKSPTSLQPWLPSTPAGGRSGAAGCRWLLPAAAGAAAALARQRPTAGRTSTVRRRAAAGRRRWTALDAGPAAPEQQDIESLGEWCPLVINLARREDRLRNLRCLLGETANDRLRDRLERLTAVDGKKLDLGGRLAGQVVEAEALARAKRAKRLGLCTIVHGADNELVHFDDHLTPGAVACAVSHRKALLRVASHPAAGWGLILEDDVSAIVPDADRVIARVLRALPEDWSAVFLGYHHSDGCPHPRALTLEAARAHGSQGADGASQQLEQVVGARLFEIHDHVWGLYAWMVRKEAAQELVDSLFPIRGQVDYAISSWLVRHRGGVYAVHPDEMLFYSPPSEVGQDSDIQTMTDEDEVVEQHGSLRSYLQELRPHDYRQYDSEDLYDILGDYVDGDRGMDADDDLAMWDPAPTSWRGDEE